MVSIQLLGPVPKLYTVLWRCTMMLLRLGFQESLVFKGLLRFWKPQRGLLFCQGFTLRCQFSLGQQQPSFRVFLASLASDFPKDLLTVPLVLAKGKPCRRLRFWLTLQVYQHLGWTFYTLVYSKLQDFIRFGLVFLECFDGTSLW